MSPEDHPAAPECTAWDRTDIQQTRALWAIAAELHAPNQQLK